MALQASLQLLDFTQVNPSSEPEMTRQFLMQMMSQEPPQKSSKVAGNACAQLQRVLYLYLVDMQLSVRDLIALRSTSRCGLLCITHSQHQAFEPKHQLQIISPVKLPGSQVRT